MAKRDDEKEARDEKKPVADPPDEVVVGKDAEDDDDDGEASPAAETEAEKQTRRERRRERGKLHKEMVELKERYDRLERERSEDRNRHEREMGILRLERIAEQRKSATPEEDPIDRELKAVRSEESSILSKFRLMTPEDQEKHRDEYMGKIQECEDRRGVLYAKKAIPRQPQQSNQPDEATMHNMMMKAKYPQVYANQAALRFAGGTYDRLVAKGAQAGPALSEQALREAMAEFGFSGQPDASDAERRRFISTPRGGREGAARQPKTVAMTREHKEMANAAFGHIKDERKRWQAWAESVMADEDAAE